MVKCVLVLVAVVGVVGSIELTDEDYSSMPKLFELDDFDECLSTQRRRSAYCVGSFDLLPYRNDRLLNLVQEYSLDSYHFNHSKIHRGLCITSTCSHIKGPSLAKRFDRCVSNFTRSKYGLETNLTELQYCRTANKYRQVDEWDMIFLYIVGVVLLLNTMGTVYDLMKNKDIKSSKPWLYMQAWSLVENWKRLTADYSDGDSRLTALKPVQGMKALTLLLVMLAHSVLAFHLTYLYNPQYLEKTSQLVLSAYLQNGSSIVQSFIMVSTFLLAYNLLIYLDSNPDKTFGMHLLCKCLLHRISRITPLYLFILGLATTWWAHASDGPLWGPLIEAETERCRNKWWAHIFYVNNLVMVEEKCLLHTWFLAVDMQLYILCTLITLALTRSRRFAVYILLVMIFSSVLLNFVIISHWDLSPMLKLMVPEKMRTNFKGERSFTWLYSAPWDSLPSALIGLLVAFIYYKQQSKRFNAAESKLIRILYRGSVPCMFLWVVSGYFMKPVTDPNLIHLYAAIDRPMFMALTAVAMYGFFNKIDSTWWKFMSWRGWEILGRMSLSIYLIHWLIALLLMGVRTNTSRVSFFEVGGHWLSTVFLTYCAALPLHLLIELPVIRFLQPL